MTAIKPMQNRQTYPMLFTTATTTILWPLYRPACISQHLQLRTEEDFVDAKFYCLHALAGGDQRIRIKEMLEFSSTVLSTPSLYLYTHTHTHTRLMALFPGLPR